MSLTTLHAEQVAHLRSLADADARRAYLETLEPEDLHAVAQDATGQKLHARMKRDKRIDFTLRHLLPAPPPTAAPASSPTPVSAALLRLEVVALVLIHPSPTNPRKRFPEPEMKELTDSIRRQGVLQPLLLRPHPEKLSEFENVAGERRRRGATAAGLVEVPAVIREMTDREVLEAQLVENGQRADAHPLEEADAIQHLHEPPHNATVEDIAAKLGKSPAYVYSRLRLATLGAPAREAFLEDQLLASVALLLARVSNAAFQAKATESAVNVYKATGVPMPLAQAKRELERYFLKLAEAPFDTTDAGLVPAAGTCASCPKRSGNQGELFAEVALDDTCTDPLCYQDKVEATWQAKASAAKEAGRRVLSEDEAKKVYPYQFHDQPQHGSGFVALDEKCWDDKERRTYRELLGDKLPEKKIVLARQPFKGETVELLETKGLVKLLARAGHKFVEEEDDDGTTLPPTRVEDREDNEAPKNRERDRQARELLGQRAMTVAVEIAERHAPDRNFWLALLLAQCELDDYAVVQALEAGGLEVPDDWEPEKDLERITASTKEAKLRGLLVRTLLTTGTYSEPFKAFSVLGVDVDQLRDAAREEVGLPPLHPPGVCRICHCTDKDGCPSGCSWAGDAMTLCTVCAGQHEDETQAQTFVRLVDEQGLSVYSVQRRWPDLSIAKIDVILEKERDLHRPPAKEDAKPKKRRGGKKASS